MDVVEKEQFLSPFSSKAASPIGLGTHPYDLIYLLKTLSSIITLTVRLRHGNQGGGGLGGGTNIQPLTECLGFSRRTSARVTHVDA